MPSDNGAAWSPPAGTGERRLSNSSDGSSGSGYSKALPSDSTDYLQLRAPKLVGGKPAANPLQFVKVGPCELYRSAQEQLKRSQEVKKSKEVKKEELEDWQSNLDNWKSSRRKRVEHIIERCVEVKRMENEPVPGARSKSKTFNEMLEERAGKRRRCPLALYPEEEATDLSDLGIGTSSNKSSLSEDCDTHSLASDGVDLDKNHSDVDNMSNCGSGNRKLGSSANEYDTCTTTTISSPEPEEYTYEGAIEGYKSRISSQTHTSLLNSDYKGYTNNNFDKDNSPDKVTNGDINRTRTTVSNKIEERVSSLQQNKNTDIRNNNQKKDLPKVDILKRREQFEKESSPDTLANKPRLPEITNKKSIKERLSSLEKFTEETQAQHKSSNDLTKLPTEVVPLKERLSSLEKTKAAESEKTKPRLSNGDLGNTKSVKERLSSLRSQTSEEDTKIVKTEVNQVSMSLKERLSSLDAAKNKEIPKQVDDLNNNDDATTKEIDKMDESKDNRSGNSLRENLSGIESQMQNFCRSLDSLDINGTSSPSSFERVQSLEDLESCNEAQNNTSPSDIETEDSGIHTARGSCAPGDETNDINDLIPIEASSAEPIVSEYESSNEDPAAASYFAEEADPAQAKNFTEAVVIDLVEEQDVSRVEDTDSAGNYHQAMSQPNDDASATDEITEIQLDNDDEDTLKSLDAQDTSVIDALELAFQEIDGDLKVDMDPKATDDSNAVQNDSNEAVDGEDKTPSNIPAQKNMAPVYENIEIFYENGGVLESAVDVATFPLDLPRNLLEPPKEKPPPPPTEDCVEDDVALGNGNFKSTNSTRRIKKEIRNKRTSFLGIKGQVDDSYLDVDLKLAPRPDITSFLQEETKIERLLYKKTLSHDMDSKLRESRDSGVDLDRGPSAEAWDNKHSSPDTSNPHSRQNSEPYTHVTVTSDEDEAARKHASPSGQRFNDKLTTKLEHLQGEPRVQQQAVSNTEHSKIDHLDKQLRRQQEVLRFERELLQLEQEELRRQRDNLLLRESQTRRKQKSVQDVNALTASIDNSHLPSVRRPLPKHQDHRHSMPNLLVNQELDSFVPFTAMPVPQVPERRINGERNHQAVFHDSRLRQAGQYDDESKRHVRYVDDNQKCHIRGYVDGSARQVSHVTDDAKRQALADDSCQRQMAREMQNVRPSAPIPLGKPRSKDSAEREITMRSSRVPSAVEYANVDKSSVQLRPKPIVNGQVPGPNGQYHPMSRHTLQQLSAVPTSKLISGAEWLQARSRKQIPPVYNYNHHWLIQEAEQRRIDEQRSKMRSKQLPSQRHSYHHDPTAHNAPRGVHNLGASQQQPTSEQPLFAGAAEPAAQPAGGAARDGETMLSVSGRKKCSHCGEELGRGAAMIIESLELFYHVWCFSCVVCGARLGDGRAGADVRVRARRLHCHQCYSSDDGSKFSCV